MSVHHDTASGLWTLTAPHETPGAPVVFADRVHLPLDGRVTALDCATARVLRQTPHRVEFHSDCVSVVPAAGEHLLVPNSHAYMTDGDMISFRCAAGVALDRRATLVRNRLERLQDRPDVRDGFLTGTGLSPDLPP
ncbi:hypothetical protein AB0D10_30665 [Kitasatospora sp. NPDC048545]|uniref:hypothetical protein n=1 Tax=Kitasatospora sp. NPDC048545 TaxID=3157208 RepID=UPI0033F65FF5